MISSRRQPGRTTSSRAPRSARRCSSLRAFMFERVYLGPAAEAERKRGRGHRARASSTTCAEHPDELPSDSAGRPAAAPDGLRGRHDRPVRARMALIKPASVREVVEAADMVEIVSAKTAAQAGRRPLDGPLPVPRGAHAELLGQPGREAVPLLRLRGRGRRDHLHSRDGRARLRPGGRVAGRPPPGRARVRGVVAGARAGPEAA